MPDGKFVSLTPELYGYVVSHGANHDALLAELADETARLMGGMAMMQISPEQGTFMTILARAIGTRHAVELGTFTGYSAICIARALPPDGTLLCCDISPQWTAVARRYWEKAGLSSKIELKLAPALETLRALPANEIFDFAFIDADKTNQPAYYEEILKRLRPNGLILIDNVLWNGQVLNQRDQTPDTCSIRELNDSLPTDNRVDVVMLAVADGLTICRKK
ncbi:MAG: class I SAM-dependent methyltransferase [Deltaproteobacteria bacterium]|nr:class I SAM-dependent methyltransferase [Deltaproteobacteria bacterium]